MTQKDKLRAIIDEIISQLPDISAPNLERCVYATGMLCSPEKMITRKQMISELTKATNATKRLEDILSSINPSLLNDIIELMGIDLGKLYPYDPSAKYMEFIKNLHELSYTVSSFLETVKRNKAPQGRREDHGLNYFIMLLSIAYEETTGHDAKSGVSGDHNHENFQGPFFQLVIGCLKAGGITYQSANALGEKMRRVLNNREQIAYRLYAKPGLMNSKP